MAIKDLLVAYNDDPGARNALALALQKAKKHGAVLTGIYVYPQRHYGGGVRRWISDDVLQRVGEAELAGARAIETAFRERVAAAGHAGEVQFQIASGQPDLTLARAARHHDLLLIGQFVAARAHERKALQPEQLLMRAGKPLIIVPAGHAVRPLREEAAVAWDGSRSAARALSDAMQILETKKKLDILTVRAGPAERGDGDMPDEAIVTHLKRHGVAAQHVALSADGAGIGQALVDYCASTQPDMLVMGAFGRAKFGALLFGGVTRRVLENTTVPVLMSY